MKCRLRAFFGTVLKSMAMAEYYFPIWALYVLRLIKHWCIPFPVLRDIQGSDLGCKLYIEVLGHM